LIEKRHECTELSRMPRTRRAPGRPGGPRPRTRSPTRQERLQLVAAALRQPAPGASARGQDAHRQETRRPTGPSAPAAPPPAAPTPPTSDPLRSHDLRPLSGPVARRGRPRRPRADVASGRRLARSGRPCRRIPRARPHLPLLRRSHPRRRERGRVCGCAKTAAACRELLAVEPALWTFAFHEGVEPTNNHAERMLTVVQTLRLQRRSVLAYLEQALRAHRNGLPAPILLPTG
jgi:hypothetical protein